VTDPCEGCWANGKRTASSKLAEAGSMLVVAKPQFEGVLNMGCECDGFNFLDARRTTVAPSLLQLMGCKEMAP